jgi:Transposase DDE domain
MRHGRKTPWRRFTGYKLHATAATEAPILTALSLSAASEHDGHHAGALVDQQPKQRRPKRLIGDTAYGNVEARERLEERSVSVLAPVHTTSARDGAIPKDEFAIDLETDTVTCPRGKTTPIYKPRPNRPTANGERVARFAEATASPARSASSARRAVTAISASAAARTCARPRSGRYPTPASATISSAPGRESSGCSDSSSTATEGARAATSGPQNPPSRPSGQRSSSTSTRSQRPAGPRGIEAPTANRNTHAGDPRQRESGPRKRPFFSGLVEKMA